MADASFIFETNIKQVSKEIEDGLTRIQGLATANQGAGAGQLVSQLAPGIKKDAQEAVKQLQALKAAYDELARSGKGLAAGQPTFAGRGQEVAEQLSQQLREKVRQAGIKADGSLGDIDLTAIYRDLDQLIVRRVRTDLRKVIDQADKAGDSAFFGTKGQVPTGVPKANLGTVADVQRVNAQAISAAQEKIEADRAAAKATRDRENAETRLSRQLASVSEQERQSLEAAKQATEDAKRRSDAVKQLLASQSADVQRLPGGRVAVGGQDPDVNGFYRKRGQDFERLQPKDADYIAASADMTTALRKNTADILREGTVVQDATKAIAAWAAADQKATAAAEKAAAATEAMVEDLKRGVASARVKSLLSTGDPGAQFINGRGTGTVQVKGQGELDGFYKQQGQDLVRLHESDQDYIKAQEQVTRSLQQRERTEQAADQAAADAQRRRGIQSNFLAGLTNPGFGTGGGGFDFDGLARSAGQAVKYSALYPAVYKLQAALAGVVTEFLDANNSITELQVAMQTTDDISVGFTNDLQDFAAVGGFNVGEAMDVAASGIRAFGDEVRAQGGDVQQFGEAFAQQAGRIAVLSKTTLADAAGNLKAITAGFELPTDNVGLTRVTDAIAGAKVLGGGDEKQIGQGLANSAITFKQLGFSLNEAAVLISRINASTDESGQLIATRLTRIGAIISGSGGRNFITNLNQQLAGKDKIDLTGSVRDQLIQIGKLYSDTTGKISATTKNQIRSALGGEQAGRELVVTLQQAGLLTKDIDKQIEGKGAKEFGLRLKNVSNQLLQIKGNIDGIVTNIALSGIAAPIELAARAAVPLTAALRDITQLVNQIADGFGGLGRVLIGVAATTVTIGAALRAIAAIRAAGGPQNALYNLERAVRPLQAEARGRQAAQARDDATALAPATAADGRVAAAAQNLRRASDEYAAAATRLAELQATAATEEQLAAARAEVNQTRANLVEQRGGLTGAEREQQALARVGRRFENLRNDLTDTASADSGRLQARAEVAERAGELERAAELRQQEEAVRARFTAQLEVLDAEEALARKRAIAQLELGPIAGRLDRISGGVLSARRVAADEGAGALAATGTGVRAGAEGFAGGLGGLAGGLGIALALGVAADAVSNLYSTAKDIDKASKDARKTASQIVGINTDLKEAAANNNTAADNLNAATDSIFANGPVGDAARRQRKYNRDLATAETDAQKKLDDIAAKGSRSADVGGVAASLDLSSVDNLNASIKNLEDQGQRASTILNALGVAIRGLAFVSSGQVGSLTAVQQQKLVSTQGLNVRSVVQKALADADKTLNDVNSDPTSGAFLTAAMKKGLLGNLDTGKLDTLTESATSDFLKKNQGANLTDPKVIANYKKILEATYEGASIDPLTAQALADAEAQNLLGSAKALQTELADPEKFKALAQASPVVSQAAAGQAQQVAQLKAIRAGTPDKSASVGAQAGLSAAQTKYQELKTAGDKLVETGKLTVSELAVALQPSLDAITTAQIAVFEAAKSDAQATLAYSAKVRQARQRAATTQAEVERIGKAALASDIKTAIKTADEATIEQVFNNASKQEIAAIQKEVDKKAAIFAAIATADQAVAAVLTALGSTAAPAAQATAATAQGIADTARAQANAVNAAAAGANPQNNYDTGRDNGTGQTLAQIQAERAKGEATRRRDSIALARAAKQAAEADLAAASNAAEEAKAQTALYQAKNALADALRSQADSARRVGQFKDSAVQQARLALAEAASNLRTFAKTSPEYNAALDAYIQAQRDLAVAARNAYFLHIQAGSDLTDPVAQANIELRKAKAKLAQDRRAGKPQDVIDQDRVDVKNAQNGAEAALFNQRLSDAQTADQLGRISHKAYLQYLQNEHDRLTAIKGKTRQQRDELNQVDQAIKAANEQLQGQFNLGDIKVPTVYEVRRAIAAQTGSSTVSATTNSVVNNNQQVTVNGADFAKVVDYLKQALGPQGSARLTVAPRKG